MLQLRRAATASVLALLGTVALAQEPAADAPRALQDIKLHARAGGVDGR